MNLQTDNDFVFHVASPQMCIRDRIPAAYTEVYGGTDDLVGMIQDYGCLLYTAPLEIVYEDDDLLGVNKPKGMVVHPAAGNYTGTLVNCLLYTSRCV